VSAPARAEHEDPFERLGRRERVGTDRRPTALAEFAQDRVGEVDGLANGERACRAADELRDRVRPPGERRHLVLQSR
jgi:hypothetical protein